MASSNSSSVLVVGAAGYFGQLLVADLIEFSRASPVILAGRNRDRLEGIMRRHQHRERLDLCVVDLERPDTVSAALEGVRVAICAAGPFQRLPRTLARLCIERGVPYIDFSDDRRFTEKVHHLAGEYPGAMPPICSGWSAVPALAGVLARIAVEGLDRVASVDIQIAPGNRMPRAHGTVASLLNSVGRSFPVWRDGRWQTVRGWSEPRPFAFPHPVGSRIGYLVDVPAHDSFIALFPAARVEFRVGSELWILNQCVSALSRVAAAGLVQSFVSWTPFLRTAMAAFGSFGTEAGGVGVEAEGAICGRSVRRRASIVAGTRGQLIPVMPATITTSGWLTGADMPSGIVPVDRWISRSELETECDKRGFDLIIEEEGT